MYLRREFKFDAAHNLINYRGKCEVLHGHTYKLAVTLKGEPDGDGMVFDFVELKKIVGDLVLSQLDHVYINDIISQPTAEYIAAWIFKALDEPLRRPNCELHEIQVWETASSSVIICREDVR